MTLTYYSFADKYIEIIRNWYFLQYGIKITKKHAVLFSIGNISTFESRLTNVVCRLKIKMAVIRHVPIENNIKWIVDKIRFSAMVNTSLNMSGAVTLCIIQFALSCKIKRHTFNIEHTPLSKEQKEYSREVRDFKFMESYIP